MRLFLSLALAAAAAISRPAWAQQAVQTPNGAVVATVGAFPLVNGAPVSSSNPLPTTGGEGGSSNIATINGVTINLGQTLSASSLPVVIASDQSSVPVTASQGTAGASPWETADSNIAKVYAAQAASSPAGEIVSGGVYNSTEPTLASGEASQDAIDSHGNLFVDPVSGSLVAVMGANATAAANTANGVPEVEVMPSAATTVYGPTPTQTTAAASSLVVKSSGAGLLYEADGTSTAAGDFVLLNATSAPSTGATLTPLRCVAVAANGTASFSIPASMPEYFSAGIVMLFTTGGCYLYTAASGAFMHADYK